MRTSMPITPAGGDHCCRSIRPCRFPGASSPARSDVVRFDGAAYTIAFDAAANDLPRDVNVDAVAVSPGGLFLSFDISVRLEGTTFEDEDVVQFVGGSPAFEASFTGADAGVPSELDLDGVQAIGPQRLLVSFDGSGRIEGVGFNDEDVLEYHTDDGTWELAYAGVSNHAGWAAADLVAPYGIVAGPTATPTETSGPSPTPTATAMATESEGPATPTSTPPVSVTPTATSDGSTATPTLTGQPTATPTASPTGSPGACTGDCDGNGQVTVDELITIVRIALGQGLVADCIDADANDDGPLGIDEIVAAVGRALDGC